MIKLVTEENKTLYDLNRIRDILKISKSKVHRLISKNKMNYTRYKNIKLYDEEVILMLMRIIFEERINKYEL